MLKLSVNINKIATLRNARGGNNPDLVMAAQNAERFGAQGITIHPRPDERHIRYEDAFALAQVVNTELNIEGNPQKGRYLEIIEKIKPAQATLVPDSDDVLTSNAGWDTLKHKAYLTETIAHIQSLGVRVSLFIDPVAAMIEGAAAVGADRIELYTESYAQGYKQNREKSVAPYVEAAALATSLALGLNAGHDLDLKNLAYLYHSIPNLQEVSIGHALISDALYYGLENTIQMYLRAIETAQVSPIS
ncbi:MAG: pyridoxine 5'-phosphate synthase [Bernardetiaceae bacterium]|nr:pyridoxine 5'-phosphate synthase [Bernardetiaceae bacterium]